MPGRLLSLIAFTLVATSTLLMTAAASTQEAGAASGARQVSRGGITVVCRLTLGGSFDASSDRLEGRLASEPNDGSRLTGVLQVPLDSLDTGIGLRNAHMRDNYLETSKGPDFSHARLTQIRLERGEVASNGGRTAFDAMLTLHGVERAVRGEVKLSRVSEGMRAEAKFPVHLPDYGIPEPRYLGIGVRDDVEVRVDATFTVPGGTR